MSRHPRRLILLCGMALMTLAAGRAHAQAVAPPDAATADVLAREARRIDSLYAAREAVKASMDRARAEREAAQQQTQDTVQVGPFLVHGDVPGVHAAARHIADAWAFYEPMVGTSADRLRGIEFHSLSNRQQLGVAAGPGGRLRVGVSLGSGMRPTTRERVARAAVGRALALHLPEPLKEWLRGGEQLGPPVPLVYVHRELATSPSQSAQQCHRGDVDACVDALGLSAAGDSSAAWYTTEQLRWLIARGNSGRGAADACVNHGNDAACHAYFREQPKPLSLGKEARLSLLQHALQLGGTGAYTRLIESDLQDARALIPAVSAQTLEQTTASWRAGLMAAAPSAHAGVGRTLGITLVWLVIITLIGMRSTRWRIG